MHTTGGFLQKRAHQRRKSLLLTETLREREGCAYGRLLFSSRGFANETLRERQRQRQRRKLAVVCVKISSESRQDNTPYVFFQIK
jgi:hypothetical protein